MPPWAHAVKYAFVTSEIQDGSINEGAFPTGIDSANEICRRLAQSAGSIIPAADQAGPWLAWLSTSTPSSPSTTLTQATVPDLKTDGAQIAADGSYLISGTLQSNLSRDETGSIRAGFRWAGTTTLGTPGPTHCLDWTTTRTWRRWPISISTPDWTFFSTVADCATARPWYCFEQGAVPVELKAFTVE